MAVAAVAVIPLCNKYGKRIICMLGMLLGAVGGVIAIIGNGSIVPVAIKPIPFITCAPSLDTSALPLPAIWVR